MSNKKTLLIAIFIVIVLLGVGYILFKSSNTDNSSNVTPTPTLSRTPSITPSATPTPNTSVSNSPTPTPRRSITYRTATPTPTATPTGTSSSSSSGSSGSSTSSPTSTPSPCATLGNKSDYDNTIFEDSPVAYYPFIESSAACDHSGNGLNGSKYGNLQTTTLPNGDTALVFDGVQDYVEVADNDSLSVTTTGKLTMEAWIRPDTLQFLSEEGSGYVHWMGKGVAGQHEYLARMYSYINDESRPNRISGYAFNSTGGLGVGSYFQDALTAGQWIHYVFVINTADTSVTYPMGYTKIYKNGSQRDQDNLATLGIVPTNGNAPLRIGTRDFDSYFEGAIAKVAIYDYELSPFQVLEHYQEMIPPVPGTASYVQNVGQVNTKTLGTSMQIPVTNTVPVGDTLIARVVTDYAASAPTITDSKGNTYTRDRTAPNSGNNIRAAIYSAPITNALEPGDTITITTPNVAAKAAVVDQFTGLLTANYLDQQNGTSGESTTPGTTISITTTQENELIIGFTAVEGPVDDTFSEDLLGQFESLPREGTEGGDDISNVTVNGGYKSIQDIGTYQYRPILDPSRKWINFILSYKAL